ncbi:tetratricopeptide repeat protein [Desulfobacterales bacterium HSG2]|nr:tetratricopeptide repeat protein [Desulfobacterales bacterium HSG2]
MAKCWTCGSHVSGYQHTCSSCRNLKELKGLHAKVASGGRNISERLDFIAQVQQEGFATLKDTLSTGLSEIASAIEWGFGEIGWKIEQQTEILQSIDRTLKTPSETKANEWRLHAEELRRRGLLEESEEFFLKAINEYRLDYRMYVGLAETYLRLNKFDEAKSFLEKSLPHAPKKRINYKSYSYRMIGHIYGCKEDYAQAVSILRSAVELSPQYIEAHYDYAQYCAQVGNVKACIPSVQKAVLAKPLYWYLAQNERNFDSARSEVGKLLSNINTEALQNAKDATDNSGKALKKSLKVISETKKILKGGGNSITIYENAEKKFELAEDKMASGDYAAFLKAKVLAEEAYTLANKAAHNANEQRKAYKQKHDEKVGKALKRLPGAIIGWPLLFAVVVGVVSTPINFLSGIDLKTGFLIGAGCGLLFGLYRIIKELKGR